MLGFASPNSPVSVVVLFGTYGIGANNVTLNLDWEQRHPDLHGVTELDCG